MKSHKDLIVWQKSMDHVAAIYVATKAFPNEELFGIVSQMRRAAVSIPSNIAEGYGRLYDKETVKFLSNALGSASELETQLIISKDLGFINRGFPEIDKPDRRNYQDVVCSHQVCKLKTC